MAAEEGVPKELNTQDECTELEEEGIGAIYNSDSSMAEANHSNLLDLLLHAAKGIKLFLSQAQEAEGKRPFKNCGGERLKGLSSSYADGAHTAQDFVKEKAALKGPVSNVGESSSPIIDKTPWVLTSEVGYCYTNDWSIHTVTHQVPPMLTRDSKGAVGYITECGDVSGDITMRGVMLDLLADFSGISVGDLVRRGCEVDLQEGYGTIKKEAKVIWEGKQDPDGLYRIYEFDGSLLEPVCPGCRG
ncbi:hypothetical protein ACP70R_008538 [Stipagrostis hirtigluma subsp. patula]